MKTSLKLAALFALVTAAVPAFAQMESLKVIATTVPAFSPSMLMEGITKGTLVVAVSVDETGKLSDSLVLGYTHRGLVAPTMDALKDWSFTPAKIDGVPVPAQTELTINVTAQGVVVSHTNSVDLLNSYLRQLVREEFVVRPAGARELDRLPTRITTVSPAYAKAAEAEGVKGKVEVHFYIDQSGSVRMPAVSGGANPYLSQIAVDAVRAWKFEPPTAQGKPVMVVARQDFNFGK